MRRDGRARGRGNVDGSSSVDGERRERGAVHERLGHNLRRTASSRRVPPERRDTDGEGVLSLLAAELDGGRNRLGIPAGRRAVVPVEDNKTVPEPVGGVVTTSDVGTDTETPAGATTDGDTNTLAPRTVDVLGNDGLVGVGSRID